MGGCVFGERGSCPVFKDERSCGEGATKHLLARGHILDMTTIQDNLTTDDTDDANVSATLKAGDSVTGRLVTMRTWIWAFQQSQHNKR